MLVLGFCGIEILIRSFRNWHFQLICGCLHGNSEHSLEHGLGNYGILHLSCACKPHKIRNFTVSENLRAKKPLTNPSALDGVKWFYHAKSSRTGFSFICNLFYFIFYVNLRSACPGPLNLRHFPEFITIFQVSNIGLQNSSHSLVLE